MKLSVSNIAWSEGENEQVLALLKQFGICGVEFAPDLLTCQEKSYYLPKEVILNCKKKYDELGFELSSMQSILFGAENVALFKSEAERDNLLAYIKKAIDFASLLGVKNLVFGAPAVRKYPDDMDLKKVKDIALKFFKEAGDYAMQKGTVIGLEPNAKEYGTNWLTNTKDTLDFIKELDSEGVKLNLDCGTMLFAGETEAVLQDNVHLINHVHISAPYLDLPVDKEFYTSIIKFLNTNGYDKYYSIEMKRLEADSIARLKQALEMLKEAMSGALR